MAKKFENIKPGDQIELSLKRDAFQLHPTVNPEALSKVGKIVHRWHDPFEGKDYVSIAYLRQNGTWTEPKRKHTIRGLAQQGWDFAKMDYEAALQATAAAENVHVLTRRKKVRWDK